MCRSRVLALLAALAGCLTLPAAPASAKLFIGISEQSPHMFADPHFAPLELHKARIVVPWDIMTRTDYWPGYLQAWLDGAERMGVEPHVAFNIAGIEQRYFGKGPTPKQYAAMVRRFRATYTQVRVFTPWNEVNHHFQPTARRPKLAYQYYRALTRNCRGCRVLAADVADGANLAWWLRKFQRYNKGRRATWGLHNYQDANQHRSFRSSWTRRMTTLVKGPIWSTEAGGIVGFKTPGGRVAYRFSLARQLSAQRYLFRLIRNPKVRRRYERVYVYNYFGTWTPTGSKSNRWDSGLLSTTGTPRPAYRDLVRQIARNR